MCRRVDNWTARLYEIVGDYKTHDYVWGVSDCGTFAHDIVHALIGVDLYKGFESDYDSERGYLRVLAKYNCTGIISLFDLVASKNKIVQIDVKKAMRGDIVAMLGADEKECLGVCVGLYAMFHIDNGLSSIPIYQCTHAWGIH